MLNQLRWLQHLLPLFAIMVLLTPYVFSGSVEPGKFITIESDPWIPNIAHSDFIQGEKLESVKDGDWSDPETWNGEIPGNRHTVVIHHDVTFDVSTHVYDLVIYPMGKLSFHNRKTTKLVVGTLMVLEEGELIIGTEDAPILDNVSAKIVFADRSINTSMDPAQYSNGLLVFGKLEVYGSAKFPFWTRLLREPEAGDMTLRLEDPASGWSAGDQLLLVKNKNLLVTPTDFGSSMRKTEDLIVSKLSADKRQVILSSFLPKDFGEDESVQPVADSISSDQKRMPYVANLTRNIVFCSENPFGTRGHTLFAAFASVRIYHAGFYDLGRSRNAIAFHTNKLFLNGLPIGMGSHQPARYPIQFYHLRTNEPEHSSTKDIRRHLEDGGWQYQFVGNVVATTNGEFTPYKGGLCIHDSNYGLVANNVIYNNEDYGIWTKDGDERYNLLRGNFVVQVHSGLQNEADLAESLGIQLKSRLNWLENNITEAVVIADQYNPIFMDNDLSLREDSVSLSKNEESISEVVF